MQTRSDYGEAAPGLVQATYKLEEFTEGSGLERPLLELVKTHISQVNGCAFCIDVHAKDARAGGETERRLYGLSAWRESPHYSGRERAALAWAEAVTNTPQIDESDEEYGAARAQFSAEELVKLTVVVVAINGWNRLALAFRETAVTYDDPWNAQECDTFNNRQAEHTVTHRPGRPDPTGGDTTTGQKTFLITTPTR